ncbi:MAG TPA: SIMPL domain-containing protein, partial [Terracidiphilus sp.]|nr:SIMPL domain-containing protein [Terracidiphilus sp.]
KAAAEVIRVSIASGANKTGAIDWRLSDRKALQAKAAEAALVKARAVAERMANGLNVKLGALIYASNETPNARIYFPRPQGFTLNSDSASMVLAPPPIPLLEIRPQTVREEGTVYAVFAIE